MAHWRKWTARIGIVAISVGIAATVGAAGASAQPLEQGTPIKWTDDPH